MGDEVPLRGQPPVWRRSDWDFRNKAQLSLTVKPFFHLWQQINGSHSEAKLSLPRKESSQMESRGFSNNAVPTLGTQFRSFHLYLPRQLVEDISDFHCK